jgi:hypothetical protein
LVRFGYAATSALVGAIEWVGIWTPHLVSASFDLADFLSRPMTEIEHAWPRILHHQLDLGDEALYLAGCI